MNPDDQVSFELDMKSVNKQYIRSSKKGGQNVNKVSSCVQLTHKPTGLQVKVQDTRDQWKNEEIAISRLTDKLQKIYDMNKLSDRKNNRNSQIGTGNRGDLKKRTYRIKENIVIDHISGKSCSWKEILKGRLELLF